MKVGASSKSWILCRRDGSGTSRLANVSRWHCRFYFRRESVLFSLPKSCSWQTTESLSLFSGGCREVLGDQVQSVTTRKSFIKQLQWNKEFFPTSVSTEKSQKCCWNQDIRVRLPLFLSGLTPLRLRLESAPVLPSLTQQINRSWLAEGIT